MSDHEPAEGFDDGARDAPTLEMPAVRQGVPTEELRALLRALGLPHDEIDFEFLGRSASTVQLNYFAAGKGDHGHDVELGFDPARTMADYAFEWTPEGIRWFVNGREVHAVRRQEGRPFPVTPGKICLSIWNGRGPDMETWLAPFDSAKRPLTARYERVAFTRWGEPCQFPESLVCRRNAKGSSTR